MTYNFNNISNQLAGYIKRNARTLYILCDDAKIAVQAQELAHSVDVKGIVCNSISDIPDNTSIMLYFDKPSELTEHSPWGPMYIAPGSTIVDMTNSLSSDEWGHVDMLKYNQYLEKIEWWEKRTTMPDWQDNFLKNTLIPIWPELKPHSDQIAVIYAGAQEDHVPTRVPFEDIIAHVKRCFQNGVTKIVFYNGDETMQEISLYKTQRVADFLADYIPPESIFYFSAGLTGADVYDELYDQRPDWKYRVVCISAYRFELVVKESLVSEHAPLFKKPYNIGPREKKFVCFNRVPRWHRVQLLAGLLEKDRVKDGFYSFDLTEDVVEAIEHNRGVPDQIKEQILPRKHQFPLVLNRSASRDNPVDLCPDDFLYHDESYFSIVCETLYHDCANSEHFSAMQHNNTHFLSEKIYKPFAFKHPFVLVGQPGILATLRECGYKTFHPYIDETYDTIVDDDQRMAAIVNEVDRLCSLSEAEWITVQQHIVDIIEHNFEWFNNEDKSIAYTKDLGRYFE